MLTRAKKPGQQSRVFLWEDIARFTSPLTVDRTSGVIRNVKLLGWTSANKRRYQPDAAKRAVERGLYENAKAYFDHPKRPEDSRLTDDSFGRYANVRWTPEGVFGDLVFLKSHPKAERICEDAERGLGVFGCSHNAEGSGATAADGYYEVNEILEVRSVDIVTEPATTSNLREERKRPMKTTLRKHLTESVLPAMPRGKKATAALKRLLEADDVGTKLMDAELDVAPAEEGGDWKDSLTAAIGSLVKSDDAQGHEMAAKILKMLKPEAAVEEEEDESVEEGEDEENVEEGEEEEPKVKKTEESRKRRRKSADPLVAQLQEQVARLTADKAAAELGTFILTESKKRNIPCDEHLQESMAALGDRKKIIAHMDWLKKQNVGAGNSHQAPRSRPAGATTTVTEGKLPTDGKTFAERLKARSR